MNYVIAANAVVFVIFGNEFIYLFVFVITFRLKCKFE